VSVEVRPKQVSRYLSASEIEKNCTFYSSHAPVIELSSVTSHIRHWSTHDCTQVFMAIRSFERICNCTMMSSLSLALPESSKFMKFSVERIWRTSWTYWTPGGCWTTRKRSLLVDRDVDELNWRVLIATCKQLVWSIRIGRNIPIWVPLCETFVSGRGGFSRCSIVPYPV
jgi:hypothetical protein